MGRSGTRFLLSATLLAVLPVSGSRPPQASEDPWQVLEPGLELGVFDAPERSDVGDSRIQVLRIDPDHFELHLLNASSRNGKTRTARQWCQENDLVAAINASMYQTDMQTSVSFMRTPTHVNNPHLSKDKAVLAFTAWTDSVPPVQIIDRDCQDFASLETAYGTLVQSIRMVSCKGRNVWNPQPRKWSTAAIGIDAKGHPLFIHCRSPYSTHDFIRMLLQLPIDLYNAMYVEGGPEAQLYIEAGNRQLEFVGSYETGFFQSDGNQMAWPVPNVVGIARKK